MTKHKDNNSIEVWTSVCQSDHWPRRAAKVISPLAKAARSFNDIGPWGCRGVSTKCTLSGHSWLDLLNKTIDLKNANILTFPIPVHEAYIRGDFFRVVANCIPPVKNRIEKMKIKCLLFDGFFMVCFHLYRQKSCN